MLGAPPLTDPLPPPDTRDPGGGWGRARWRDIFFNDSAICYNQIAVHARLGLYKRAASTNTALSYPGRKWTIRERPFLPTAILDIGAQS